MHQNTPDHVSVFMLFLYLTYFLTIYLLKGALLVYNYTVLCVYRVTSKLDEFTKDFHKELMKYRGAPKRRRPSYSR